MRILRLRPEEKEYFEWLDPFGMLNRLSLPHYFALVAVTEKEKRQADPAGLLIASLKKDRIIIEWICVDPEQRYQGIGTALTEKVLSLAASQDMPEVAVRFHDEDEMEQLNEDALFFFAEYFHREEPLPGEWCKESGKLLKEEFFTEDTGRYPKAKKLSETRSKDLREAIGELWADKEAHRLSDAPGGEELYDPELSAVLTDEGKICGMFLLQRVGDTVYPVFLYAESDQEAKALFLSAGKAAEETLSPDTEVRLIAEDRKCAKFAKEIFKEEGKSSYLLTMDV